MRSPPHPLLLAFTLAACPLPPDFVGETLPERTTGDATAVTGPETGVSVTTLVEEPTTTTGDASSTSTTTGVPAEGEYGSFCELGGVGPDVQRTAIVPHPVCDSGICLIVSDAPPLACAGDLACAAENEGAECGENGLCNLPPAFIAANARCTQTCALDEDCPPLAGCATGFRCTAVSLLPPLCCQKVCACQDHLDAAQADDIEATCAGDPELCL
ncbi:hypothetical protein OV203_46180 [Nannocystis sp. ILAH1]|uniref:hypothetical protein n=1 Tax=unclassified Nannocystis TaxID=2627009 RepID=UPI00226D6176|nr:MULTISPECIES: hypothetical protein [unclassified Nannocystis]MCY0994601.1 hypothetical protein [Nannocystis sp. ILAH1]MCY1063133.1 hypothetical protein [Nannocystis sp. RBIL2]